MQKGDLYKLKKAVLGKGMPEAGSDHYKDIPLSEGQVMEVYEITSKPVMIGDKQLVYEEIEFIVPNQDEPFLWFCSHHPGSVDAAIADHFDPVV